MIKINNKLILIPIPKYLIQNKFINVIIMNQIKINCKIKLLNKILIKIKSLIVI